MSDRTEALLRWAAAVSVVFLGLLVAVPESWHGAHVVGPPWSYIFGGVFGVRPVGFHFWMLIECARGGRWTVVRVSWLLFLLLLPIAPAVVYLLFTRSRTFHSSIIPPRGQ
jgi:hypothetical protein